MTDTHSDSKALGTRKERFLLGKYVAMLQVKGDNVGRSSVFGRDLCWCRALFRGGVAVPRLFRNVDRFCRASVA